MSQVEVNFNSRLTTPRNCVESAFGSMSARFRVLRSCIHLSPLKASSVVMTCVALYNYLKNVDEHETEEHEEGQDEPVQPIVGLPDGETVRNNYMRLFHTYGDTI